MGSLALLVPMFSSRNERGNADDCMYMHRAALFHWRSVDHPRTAARLRLVARIQENAHRPDLPRRILHSAFRWLHFGSRSEPMERDQERRDGNVLE